MNCVSFILPRAMFSLNDLKVSDTSQRLFSDGLLLNSFTEIIETEHHERRQIVLKRVHVTL